MRGIFMTNGHPPALPQVVQVVGTAASRSRPVRTQKSIMLSRMAGVVLDGQDQRLVKIVFDHAHRQADIQAKPATR